MFLSCAFNIFNDNRKCQDYVYVKWEYYVENKAQFETWK